MNNYRVWEHCYPDSFVDVVARDSREAIVIGVRRFFGSHHGETILVCVRMFTLVEGRAAFDLRTSTHERYVRASQDGRVEVCS